MESRRATSLKWRAEVVIGAVCLVALSALNRAQEKTVWSGVYTSEQAERGKEIYGRTCVACHGPSLEGSDNTVAQGGVALSGDHFKKNWYSSSVNDLFNKISKTMPAQPPALTGKLPEDDVLALVAYILSYNGFPSGDELTHVPELSIIDIIGRDGPEPPKSGDTARAVGCLIPGEGTNVWLLTRSTLPIKAKDTALSTGPQRERADATPLGDATIRLLNARPGTTVPAGAKVEAKGRYLRFQEEDRISVLSFQMLSSTCN
jgi:mono/diheme cytochrome c family protein